MIRMIDDRDLENRLYAVLEAEGSLRRARGMAELRRWLRARPEVCFVGASKAADILGIQAPHISRLRDKGRMPIPIPVDGGYQVYVRREVELLADELEAERRERARKRLTP